MIDKKGAAVKKRRRRRRASVFGVYRKSAAIIFMVLLLLVSMVGVGSMSLHRKNSDYKRQEAELKKQIGIQKERAEDVEEFREYVKTDEYKKEIAQEKLGLVDPDEIVFRASD